jgi:tight adherence protein C
LIYFTFFLTITFVVYFAFVLREERRGKLRRRMQLFVDGVKDAELGEEEGGEKRSLLSRVLRLAVGALKKFLRRRLPGSKEDKIDLMLLRAGKPLGMTAVDYRIAQMAVGILLPVVFGLYGKLLGLGVKGIVLLGAIALVIALVVPGYYLRNKAAQRYHKALKELPDALDLLTVSLEAGLGFDAAVGKLVARKEGVLASEFARCLEEIRLGKTRRESFTGLKDRLDFDELRVFVNSVIQAEKLGMGMVQVMRVQSQEVREQRKQRAEESAMKAPIKMLFPLVLFIFPCLFIVLLGPVVVEFVVSFNR